jgi:hypothetical protein
MDVVCLRCGCTHSLPRVSWRCLQESECPRCGYVGWTPKPISNGNRAIVHVIPFRRPLTGPR